MSFVAQRSAAIPQTVKRVVFFTEALLIGCNLLSPPPPNLKGAKAFKPHALQAINAKGSEVAGHNRPCLLSYLDLRPVSEAE